MRPLLKFIRVCSQHNAAPEVKPAVNAYRDLGTLGKGGWGRKSRLIDWYTGSQRGKGRNGRKYWARGGVGGALPVSPYFSFNLKFKCLYTFGYILDLSAEISFFAMVHSTL
jgi:hypothetical protein